ncbi:hypothetical protein Amac_050620 [Acrocarpospora macrocephala]|uniref:Uncharacterized protein n=1 Tax=Acrocarpospora macrocephala TaxID=150177 RepID=A0A5M3WQA7_9ACTN|nr:hypothetical protein Amac_050620 [Acrocarpospora macrocephala]
MWLRVTWHPTMRSEVTILRLKLPEVTWPEAIIPRSRRAEATRTRETRTRATGPEFMWLRVTWHPTMRSEVTIRRSGRRRMLGFLGSRLGLRRWRCGLVRRCC